MEGLEAMERCQRRIARLERRLAWKSFVAAVAKDVLGLAALICIGAFLMGVLFGMLIALVIG